MVERLSIARVGHRGDGIAEDNGEPIYVSYALPGESVEVEAWPEHRDRRRLVAVMHASPDRIAPFCPHFTVCGGCAIQHWVTAPYRTWKRDLVVAALRQAGIEADVSDLVDAHGEGRRRATFHARYINGVLSVGFASAHSHHIVAIDRCPILAPALTGALPAARDLAQAFGDTRKPMDIQATATDGGLDIDIRGTGPASSQTIQSLTRIAVKHRLARLTRHGELVARLAAPTLAVGRARVELPPAGFLQATSAGEAELAALVRSHIGKAKAVTDLFCGIGTFALRIAENARVTAIDSDETAIACLTKATRTGLKPVAATARDLFRRPLVAAELDSDVVIFDPPRQGAEAQAREIAKCRAETVVAVSCNPATFARDARLLLDGGYQLNAVTPVDQFRHSAHVEIVAAFSRR